MNNARSKATLCQQVEEKTKLTPRYLAFAAWSALRRKKCPIPKKGRYVHINFVVALGFYCLSCKKNSSNACPRTEKAYSLPHNKIRISARHTSVS